MAVLAQQSAVQLQSYKTLSTYHIAQRWTHFCWALIARRVLQQFCKLSWSHNCSDTPTDSQDTRWRLQRLLPAILLSSQGKRLVSVVFGNRMLEPTETLCVDPLTFIAIATSASCERVSVVCDQWRHELVKLNAMHGRTRACNQEVGKG